jgi:hypothetical protein
MHENLLSCLRYDQGPIRQVWSKHDHRSACGTTSLTTSPYMCFLIFNQLSSSWQFPRCDHGLVFPCLPNPTLERYICAVLLPRWVSLSRQWLYAVHLHQRCRLYVLPHQHNRSPGCRYLSAFRPMFARRGILSRFLH